MHAYTFSTFLSTLRSIGPLSPAWIAVGWILGILGYLIAKRMMKK